MPAGSSAASPGRPGVEVSAEDGAEVEGTAGVDAETEGEVEDFGGGVAPALSSLGSQEPWRSAVRRR